MAQMRLQQPVEVQSIGMFGRLRQHFFIEQAGGLDLARAMQLHGLADQLVLF